MSEPTPAPDIRHVVVLMLENRSFDCMFGALREQGEEFDCLTGLESNSWTRPDGKAERVAVWTDPTRSTQGIRIPDPDPGESFLDIGMQIHGSGAEGSDKPTMGGFVENYMRQPGTAPRDPASPMHYFSPGQVGVLSGLARAFGVSDRWHASAPCQTWPNRLFAHTGTADGFVDNSPLEVPFGMDTVYDRLAEKGRSWRIYFHDFPQTATLFRLWSCPGGFHDFEERFAADAASGDLPSYSFIEPRYFADPFGGAMPNDDHPPHDVMHGETLVASVYDALRTGPTWKHTLFVVTYDEHGGCYDHVPPPAAVSPGGRQPDHFAFDRFGVRVPAVIISPYVKPGTVVRPPGDTPFDHTSIFATLQVLFALRSLTPRSDAAPHLLGALTGDPDNDGLPPFALATTPPTGTQVAEAAARPMNGMQKGLATAAGRLPSAGEDPEARRRALALAQPPSPRHATVVEGAVEVQAHMDRFRKGVPFQPEIVRQS